MYKLLIILPVFFVFMTACTSNRNNRENEAKEKTDSIIVKFEPQFVKVKLGMEYNQVKNILESEGIAFEDNVNEAIFIKDFKFAGTYYQQGQFTFANSILKSMRCESEYCDKKEDVYKLYESICKVYDKKYSMYEDKKAEKEFYDAKTKDDIFLEEKIYSHNDIEVSITLMYRTGFDYNNFYTHTYGDVQINIYNTKEDTIEDYQKEI